MKSTLPDRAALLMTIVVRSVPIKGLQRMLEVCDKGGMIGHRYVSCFFGTIALACGAIRVEDDDPTLQEKLFEFCSEVLQIDLIFNRPNAIEAFCHDIHARKTRKNSLELALIAHVCEQELDRRMAEQLVSECVKVTKLAGEELPLHDSHTRFITRRTTRISSNLPRRLV